MIQYRLQRLEAINHRASVLAGQTTPAPRPLQTVRDVLDLLQEQVTAVRAEGWAGTVERARAIGYLAGIALKAIETSTLAARVEMLEAVLKQRNGDNKR